MYLYNYNVEIADRCADILCQTRANAGVSRRAMSECINVSESTIKSWEQGQGSPTLSVILEWFYAVGENPFSYMLEFFWPEAFGNLSLESTDTELKNCLNLYMREVVGPHEIKQLHYLILEQYEGSWLGILDMFCAHAQTSLNSRYKIAEIIQTSYELSLANGNVQKSDLLASKKSLVLDAISAARDATFSHKQGYTAHRNNFQSVCSSILKKSRTDSDVQLSYLAKALGRTERTLKNWEMNTEPAFLDMCAWFRVLGKSMWSYLRNEIIPGETASYDEITEQYRGDLLSYFSAIDSSQLRKLCYLIFWKHGSNWHSLLELMIEHVCSPLYQRVISARSVLIGYEIDENNKHLCKTLGTLPDIENLKRWIEKGTIAAKSGKFTYS